MRVLLAALVLSVGWLILTQERRHSASSDALDGERAVIKANRFVLISENGEERAVLGFGGDGQVGLSIWSVPGGPKAGLLVSTEKRAGLVLDSGSEADITLSVGTDQSCAVWLRGSRNGPKAGLACDPEKRAAAVAVGSSSGESRVEMGFKDGSGGQFGIWAGGCLRTCFTEPPGSSSDSLHSSAISLCFFDEMGRVTRSYP